MRGLAAAIGAVLLGGIVALAGTVPAEAKSTEEFTVGQWGGYSYTDDNNGQFADCEIWAPANSDNVQLGIVVLKNYSLELWLSSKAWSLPTNGSYPISYWVDRNAQYRGRAVTNDKNTAVVEADQDQAVYDELRAGNELTFRTQDADYAFDLKGSGAALNRLLDCVDQYAKTASANPFGGGSASNDTQQTSTQQTGTQQQDNSQQGSTQQGGGSSSATLSTFTVTTDQVRDFLVEVTGAKPSMISVEQKADKDGSPYYVMKTPLGEGQFWQEKSDGTDLASIADSYVQGYKKDCSGSFEPVVYDTVKGSKGLLASGGAACSSSKYQDNGPEYLSYSVIQADGVLSFYMTYVGGNAAKAKTDGLGKLIARRGQEIIQ